MVLIGTYFALPELKRPQGHDAEQKTGASLSSSITQIVLNI
jgi:hypothetical protein